MGTLLRNDPAPVNPVFQATGFDQLGTGYALGAAASQSLSETPTADLSRTFEIGEAERGPIIAGGRGGVLRGAPETPLLEPKQANELYGIQGELSWDQPVREGVAKLQNEYALDRLKRADQLNRAQSGLVPATARVLTTLGVQALDPVNVASSFIPVVGEARFAALAGRIGIYGARAVRGAAEGAVGQALLEPITAQNADAENRDYTAYDSLVNIAMGAGLGAGLHVGGGILKDRFTRSQLHGVPEFTPPAQHEAALRGAVSAIGEGRPVRVAEYLRLSEAAGQRERLRSETMLGGMGVDIRPGDLAEAVPVLTPETPLAAATPTAPVTGFQTAKGSTYIIHEDGTTTRDKAFRPEHGEKEQGPQPTSERTFYVTREDAEKLGEFQTQGEKRSIQVRAGEAAVRYETGPSAGKFEARTRVQIQDQPAVGLLPVEVWKDGTRVHFGNEITSVTHAAAEAAPTPTAAAPTPELRAPFARPESDLPTAPPDFATAWREMVNTQRQTYEVQPEEAAILQEQARVTKGFDRPVTPEQDLSELESLAAQADEVIALARAEGRMTEEYEAALAEADQMVSRAEKQGMGLRAAAACIARALL